MKIPRAIITAAGRQQRHIPLQTFVDRDGGTRSVLQLLLEEVVAAGVDEIALVIRPDDQQVYLDAAGELGSRITFVEQTEPAGYGHAVLSAKEFAAGEPFLLMVSDHMFVSDTEGKSCAQQLVETAGRLECAVSAVQPTHESKLPFFGTIGGQRFGGEDGLYEISSVIEKPTPTAAEQTLQVPGLRMGYYLCFHGMHVLTSQVMDVLEKQHADTSGDLLHLSPALNQIANEERYLAYQLSGRRYDLEGRYGLLMAQLAVTMDGADREEVLAGIVDLLAHIRR